VLETIGFSAWFRDQADPARLAAGEIARVIAVNRESYIISNGAVEVPAEVTGKLMFNADSPLDYPAVGDWVCVQYFDNGDSAIIDSLLPRKSTLKRKTPGKKIDYQLIAGNIDTGLIVQALDANYNLRRVERYLVMINDSRIQPVVLLSKADLLTTTEIAERLTAIHNRMPGVRVMAFSNEDGSGTDAVKALLKPQQTYCMLGSSGVGKTSLLNNLLGQNRYAIRTIRDKDGRGRHTTTRRQLIRLPGGALIIDTPGMRELGNIAVEAGIEETFGEISALADQCRFSDCSHTQEQGCAILAALAAGEISPERYESFMKLARESTFHKMSFLERKQKDRQFGKMVKTVMKLKKTKR
jgi:ribosome biogenesis GTPase